MKLIVSEAKRLLMANNWKIIEATTPGILWGRYQDAIGAGNMKSWYGVHWPPACQRVGERVWVWRPADENAKVFDPTGHPAAWLSLTTDQFDPTTLHMSRGVWPDFHGYGLGHSMRQFAIATARESGADALMISVSAANTQHLANVLVDPGWYMVGVMFNPPSFQFISEVPSA